MDEFSRLGSDVFCKLKCNYQSDIFVIDDGGCAYFKHSIYCHPIWVLAKTSAEINSNIYSLEVILGNHSGAIFGTDIIKSWENYFCLPERLKLIELNNMRSILRSSPDSGTFFELEVAPLSFILSKKRVDNGCVHFLPTVEMFENIFMTTLSASGLDPAYFCD